MTFSAAYELGKRWTPFVRVGYSNGGGGALLERLVSGGVGVRLRDDFLGTSLSWGRPPDGQGPDQVTTEAFYRPQPAGDPRNPVDGPASVSNTIWVGSVLRIRLVL